MKEFKKTIEYVATDILNESMSNKLAKAILNSKSKNTNRKLIEDIFEFMLNTELWKTEQKYIREDVNYAIEKCFVNRLNGR